MYILSLHGGRYSGITGVILLLKIALYSLKTVYLKKEGTSPLVKMTENFPLMRNLDGK